MQGGLRQLLASAEHDASTVALARQQVVNAAARNRHLKKKTKVHPSSLSLIRVKVVSSGSSAVLDVVVGECASILKLSNLTGRKLGPHMQLAAHLMMRFGPAVSQLATEVASPVQGLALVAQRCALTCEPLLLRDALRGEAVSAFVKCLAEVPCDLSAIHTRSTQLF